MYYCLGCVGLKRSQNEGMTEKCNGMFYFIKAFHEVWRNLVAAKQFFRYNSFFKQRHKLCCDATHWFVTETNNTVDYLKWNLRLDKNVIREDTFEIEKSVLTVKENQSSLHHFATHFNLASYLLTFIKA